MVEAGEAFAMEQIGERRCLDEDADVGCDGQAFEAEGAEEASVNGDGEYGDDGAGDGGCAGVAGGVEGAGVDALHGPDGEGDGENAEEMRGGCGVGVVEFAAAEKIHEPGGKSDHPGRDDHADGEETGDGAADGCGEVLQTTLLEERGEEGERGGAGGGTDDVEGCVEEVFS